MNILTCSAGTTAVNNWELNVMYTDWTYKVNALWQIKDDIVPFNIWDYVLYNWILNIITNIEKQYTTENNQTVVDYSYNGSDQFGDNYFRHYQITRAEEWDINSLRQWYFFREWDRITDWYISWQVLRVDFIKMLYIIDDWEIQKDLADEWFPRWIAMVWDVVMHNWIEDIITKVDWCDIKTKLSSYFINNLKFIERRWSKYKENIMPFDTSIAKHVYEEYKPKTFAIKKKNTITKSLEKISFPDLSF